MPADARSADPRSTSDATLAINHQGQFPVVTLSFNLAPGASLGDATKAIEQAETGNPAYRASIHTSLSRAPRRRFKIRSQPSRSDSGGDGHGVHRAGRSVRKLYPSHHDSFDASVRRRGRDLALMITGNDLRVVALIGIILLIGIVKKNAIMMIDFALEAEREEHKPPEEAIYQACLLRFRPIMMTTMAALLGGLPLALGTGTGAELRRPLGITIVGGLLLSQLLTLYTTPVVYLWFDRLAQRFSRYRVRQSIPRDEPMSAD